MFIYQVDYKKLNNILKSKIKPASNTKDKQTITRQQHFLLWPQNAQMYLFINLYRNLFQK